MAQAKIITRAALEAENKYEFVTSIPEDKRVEARQLINAAVTLRNPDYPITTINMGDDGEIPKGSSQSTYKEYLTQYISKITQQEGTLAQQKRGAKSALEAL